MDAKERAELFDSAVKELLVMVDTYKQSKDRMEAGAALDGLAAFVLMLREEKLLDLFNDLAARLKGVRSMASLYGIESEDDCREKIEELLALCARAEQAMTKETIRPLNSRLAEYYRKGNTIKGRDQMSDIESRYFWPAISEAHAYGPNLARRSMWREDLGEVRWKLEKHRP